jgi:hypothetical protein
VPKRRPKLVTIRKRRTWFPDSVGFDPIHIDPRLEVLRDADVARDLGTRIEPSKQGDGGHRYKTW